MNILSFIGVPDCTVVLSPLVLALLAAIQVKVEALLLVNTMFNIPPLHIVELLGLVIVGSGFTVTVTNCEVPTHPLGIDVGVIV